MTTGRVKLACAGTLNTMYLPVLLLVFSVPVGIDIGIGAPGGIAIGHFYLPILIMCTCPVGIGMKVVDNISDANY